ncbi:hypothetical protein BUL40_15575 [Croceivirga radicis]|uniref:Uncharacterized protein n=1 Tax=Croceivirga radicis TaxID=1929488 RepID=A0A1V6LND8_9FLAO|nr:hypothetical protein [Croceivirga radicis]OQD41496.1 hypothetical protein BUL40_15575 [Croceivirga radicis]
MRIKQGLMLVVYGNKETGKTGHTWFRISRRKVEDLPKVVSRLNNFYYAKIYNYKRLGKKKGYPIKPHIAYIYWDGDALNLKYN